MGYERAPVGGVGDVQFWERPHMIHGGGSALGPGPAGQVCVMPRFDPSRGGAQSTTWPPPVTDETMALQAQGCRPTGQPCGGPAGYQGQLWTCTGPYIGTPSHGPLEGSVISHQVLIDFLVSVTASVAAIGIAWWLFSGRRGAVANPPMLTPLHERFRMPVPMYAVRVGDDAAVAGTVTSIEGGAWLASVIGLGKVRDFTGLDQAADWVVDKYYAHREQRARRNGPREDAAEYLDESKQKLYEAQACADDLDLDCARSKAKLAVDYADKAWHLAPDIWLGRRGLEKRAERQRDQAHHFLWDLWDASHAR